MIDLIIPYYNNIRGLVDTLKSIDYSIFNVIVIDDGSKIPILPPFNAKFQYWRRNINRGPGNTRQYGIDHTDNPYIMFIDTGDVFLSKKVQEEICKAITTYPSADIISFPYYHKNELTNENDNRMHGKVYKREFIERYGITFCKLSSYLNEDIGFNRTCRYLTSMKFINTPIINQVYDKDSITQKDNQASLYRDQTRALSLVSIHTIEILQKNNVSTQEEITQIAIALYYWFIRTIAERSEFAQAAWEGARVFYQHFSDQIIPNQLLSGNAYMKKCIAYRSQLHFPINILRFADEIKKFEILPNNYLT